MSRKTLAITHLLGNAILLWLAYYWLGVGESTISRLIWSALLAVLMLAAAVWLHGSGFSDFKTALQNLLPLCVFAIIVLTFYGVLAWWKDYSSAPAFKIASYITLKLRKPLKPATVQTIFNGILWLVRWWILVTFSHLPQRSRAMGGKDTAVSKPLSAGFIGSK